MYCFIFILCLNTRTSMINTNLFSFLLIFRYASARKIRRVQAEKLKKERQHYRNYKRKKEREARMDRSGYGAVKQHDGSVLSSWQSTQESVTPGSAIESTGSPFGSPNGSTSSSVLFSPKTTFELRSTYFRRLDILLRRKGGLS